jgi:predicted metal-dependent peptidase
MTTAAQKMVKARANLVMGHPFFGTLALRLKMVEDPSIETATCDGTSLRYSPKFVDSLPLSKVQGLIAHEVMHPAFLHHTRRGSRDKKKWNMACDYAINMILHNAGFDLPEGKYTNPAYNGMTAEHIYTLIPDEPDDNNGGGGDGSGGGSGGSQGNDPGGDGGVDDSPNSQNNGGSQSQQNHEEAEWKVAVAQAAHVAKQTGHLPGDIERMMEELFEPVLPWRSILRRFMTEKCNDDFSWKRGNRRFIAQGLYLPSRLSDDAMGEIVVCIDTSGSIGQKELTEFGSEIKGIVDEVRPSKVRVIYCDSRIAHIDEFGPDDDLQFAAHGGGGTDFRPPFKWLEENQIVPRALVYLTDGYGPFPEQEPEFPTLWCINNHNVTPPHGEHLILEV